MTRSLLPVTTAGLQRSYVFAYESNYFGCLGICESDKISYPTKISELKDIVQICTESHHSLFLDTHGKVFGCGKISKFISLNYLDMKILYK